MSAASSLYARFRYLIHEVAKFGIVGGVGFIVSLAGADLLRYDFGVGKYKAVTVATLAATVMTFLGNRYWTYRHRPRRGTARESVLFFLMNGIWILIQYASIATIQDGLGLTSQLWYNVANLLGIAVGTVFRFYSYRQWVWRAPVTDVLEGHESLEPADVSAPEPGGSGRGDEPGTLR
ncbi:MAG: GtrA family protein [Streptosporangiaceae bacterium]